MKIGVITDGIDDGSAGVGTYARGLAMGLPDVSSHDITFVHRRQHDFYRGAGELVYPGWGGKFVRKQVLMRGVLNSAGFDLVHETFHFPPFFGPARFAKIMTIHDMTPFVLTRRNMNFQKWLQHRLLLPPLARRAHHVLTDSQHSKDDIVRILHLPPEKVSVTHLAAEPCFYPRQRKEIELVRARYRLPERFLLFLGTIEPRKNLVRLVRAFERAAGRMGDTALVIAGPLGWQYRPILQAIRRSPVRERILTPGRIAQQDLAALLSGALAFVYPSLYEGFGLPPLEAMRCGCPVVSSNTSSLPEVVGDAALTVDPRDEPGLAAAIERISTDESLRQHLRLNGASRAGLFSWQRCARETVTVYERVAAALIPESGSSRPAVRPHEEVGDDWRLQT